MFRRLDRFFSILMVMFMIFAVNTSASFAYYSNYPVSNPTETELKNLTYEVFVWNSDQGYWSVSNLSGTNYLADGLQVWEFASYSDDNDKIYSNKVAISDDFIDSWEALVADVGDISVNCGYRNGFHNEDVGGVQYSQHKAGVAVDMITPSGYTASDFADDASNAGFVDAHVISGTNSVHADAREQTGYPTIYTNTGSGLYVFTLEDALICNDYSPVLTGFYGSTDISEVEDFQQDNGLTVDGIVGSNTWNELTD